MRIKYLFILICLFLLGGCGNEKETMDSESLETEVTDEIPEGWYKAEAETGFELDHVSFSDGKEFLSKESLSTFEYNKINVKKGDVLNLNLVYRIEGIPISDIDGLRVKQFESSGSGDYFQVTYNEEDMHLEDINKLIIPISVKVLSDYGKAIIDVYPDAKLKKAYGASIFLDLGDEPITSLDFYDIFEDYPTYGEQIIIIDKLNEMKNLTQMTASFFESQDGSKNGIKLISDNPSLSKAIHETVESGENSERYNELMEAICYATSNFDSRTQFFIVDPITDNNITIIQNGMVKDSLIK